MCLIYKNFVIVYSLLLTCCLCNRIDRFGKYFEGEQCTGSSYEGVCKKTTQCRVAIEMIKKHRMHTFTTCNFDRFEEVVCCPNEETTTTTTPKPTTTTLPPTNTETEFREPDIVRRCELECDRYAKNVKAEVKFQILNGENATAGEFPHMVGLAYRDETTGETLWSCGGSLISETYVLTAAHCIINVSRRRPFMVRMGKLNLLNDNDNLVPQDIDVDDIIVHQNYSRRTRANDIALIRLTKPVEMNMYVNPACLYTKHDDPLGLIVTGWGTISIATKMNSLTSLQKANGLLPVPVTNCNESFFTRVQTEVKSLQICAIDPEGKKDACQGDSGGPLQVQDKKRSNIYSIVGVTSIGISCGGTVPGLYTRVSQYVDWIESIVWPSN